MLKIITIGEILVELVADTPGYGFREPIAITGPYPSGAPAIFIDQAARMGAATGIVSAVGDDDFGRVNLDRLEADGVDVSAVRVDTEFPTGTAFVRYRPDGARDFVYNITHSACGTIAMSPAAETLIGAAGHLHVVGNALFSPAVREMTQAAATAIRARGGTVSFDPNLRKEMLGQPGMRDAVEGVLATTDLFLPSGEELFLGLDTDDFDDAIAAQLGRGMRAVVFKQGSAGASYFDGSRSIHQPVFPAEEIDPTGAGDCFGGAFVALWKAGAAPDEALRLASAAGALAVMKRGPMEGAEAADTVRAFADSNRGL